MPGYHYNDFETENPSVWLYVCQLFFWILFFGFVIIIVYGSFKSAFGQEQRTVTLTVPAVPAFEFKEAYLFTDSAEVKVGNARVWFKPLRGRSVIAKVHDKGKIFEDGFSSEKGGGADIIREKKGNQVKETVVIRDTAITEFKFQIKTNTGFRRVRDYIILDGIGHIEPPSAWDSNNKAVGSWFTLSGDTLTYFWDRTDTSNFTYPIYIDPTITIQPGDLWGWGMDCNIASASPTNNFNSAYIDLGTYNANVRRAYFKFDSIYEYAKGYTIDSARFSFYTSGTYANGGLEIAFPQANWVDSTLTWGTKPAHDSLSAMVPDSQWVTTGSAKWITFNVTAYVDSIANKGKRDSGIVVMATNESNIGFYANESIVSSEGATYKPKLVIYYSAFVPPALTCSLSIPSRYDTIRFHVAGDTASVDSVRGYKIVGTDTLAVTANYTGGYNNVRFDSASQKTRYILIAGGYDGGIRYFSNADTILTPWSPSAPTGVTASGGDSTTSVLVSWSTVDSATSYVMFRSTTSGGTYDSITTTTAISYNDTGAPDVTISGAPLVSPSTGLTKWVKVRIFQSSISVVNGANRFYKIRAKNLHGSSSLSAIDTGYTSGTIDTSGNIIFRGTGVTPTILFKSGAGYETLDSTASNITIAQPTVTASKTKIDTITVTFSGTTTKGTTYYYRGISKISNALIYSDTSASYISGYKSGVVTTYNMDTSKTQSGTYTRKYTSVYSPKDFIKATLPWTDSIWVKVSTNVTNSATVGGDTTGALSTATYGFAIGDSGSIIVSRLTDSTATVIIAGDFSYYSITDSTLSLLKAHTVYHDTSGDTTITNSMIIDPPDTMTIESLPPDTMIYVNLNTITTDGDTIFGIDSDTTWTNPKVPGLRATRIYRDVAHIYISPYTNPSYTRFGVRDSVTSQYINYHNGFWDSDTSASTWGTYDDWGKTKGFRLWGFYPLRTYILEAVAKRSAP